MSSANTSAPRTDLGKAPPAGEVEFRLSEEENGLVKTQHTVFTLRLLNR
jgi:hypothetical protein